MHSFVLKKPSKYGKNKYLQQRLKKSSNNFLNEIKSISSNMYPTLAGELSSMRLNLLNYPCGEEGRSSTVDVETSVARNWKQFFFRELDGRQWRVQNTLVVPLFWINYSINRVASKLRSKFKVGICKICQFNLSYVTWPTFC